MGVVMLVNTGSGLIPVDDAAKEALGVMRIGEVVKASITRPRNLRYHRRFFKMLDLGFDAWESTAHYKGEPIQKNREQFRHDVTILAGYWEMRPRIDGTYRTVAKSISFASMGQEEFEQVYSRVADVILQKVLTTYTRDDLDLVVDELLSFV